MLGFPDTVTGFGCLGFGVWGFGVHVVHVDEYWCCAGGVCRRSLRVGQTFAVLGRWPANQFASLCFTVALSFPSSFSAPCALRCASAKDRWPLNTAEPCSVSCVVVVDRGGPRVRKAHRGTAPQRVSDAGFRHHGNHAPVLRTRARTHARTHARTQQKQHTSSVH